MKTSDILLFMTGGPEASAPHACIEQLARQAYRKVRQYFPNCFT